MINIAWWPEEEFCIEKVKEHFKDVVCYMVDKRIGEDIYRFPVQESSEIGEKVEQVLRLYGGANFPVSIEFAYYSQDDKTEVCSVKNYPERIFYENLPTDLLSLVSSSSRELLMCLAFVRIFVDTNHENFETNNEPFLLKAVGESLSLIEEANEEKLNAGVEKGEIECDCGRCELIEDFLNELDKS